MMNHQDFHLDSQSESPSALSKEEAHQLIKAAGQKQSSQALQELIESKGYTASQLDALASDDDTSLSITKTPLHQACWKGHLQSIKYLVETLACDVNVYSRQTYSYGKTAIFFALTQSRKEVVEYLLSRPDINVSIVNNKGQSVLTLAASHGIPINLLQEIQSKEETDLSKWWNFRATHSDHLEYGDLDPRFLERPLKDTDVVTEYAVNGTTKQSRKGAFQRRNPEAAKEWQRYRQQSSQGKKNNRNNKDKKETRMGLLSKEQQQAVDNSWQVLSSNRTSNNNTDDMELLNAIVTIIEQSDGLRKPWIPEMADRLLELGYDYNSVSMLTLATTTTKDNDSNNNNNDPMTINRSNGGGDRKNGRTTSLFLKLMAKLQGDNGDDEGDGAGGGSKQNDGRKQKKVIPMKGFGCCSREECTKIASPLQHLSISSLEESASTLNGGKKELGLNNSTASIVFVDTYEGLRKLWERLQSLAASSSSSSDGNDNALDDPFVLAMDSEWMTIINEQSNNDGSTQLSTLQLAFCDPSSLNNDDDETPLVWVYIVDMLVTTTTESEENNKNGQEETFEYLAQKLVHWMIYNNESDSNSGHRTDKMWLLGFALGHDLRILREFCCKHDTNTQQHCRYRSQMLDLQILLRARKQSHFPTKQLPGLKTCTKLFSSWELSKEEQRSDWSPRPLSQSQIQYAALDAAILLFLLAEEYRPVVGTAAEQCQ